MAVALIVRSVHGLEWVAADEIAERVPGAEALTMSRREVSFTLPVLDPVLLALRTADDVFLTVGRVDGVGTTRDEPSRLAGMIAALPWEDQLDELRRIRPFPDGPRFDVVASLEGRRTYNRFSVENAIGAALTPVFCGAFLTRTSAGQSAGDPDLTVRVFLRAEAAIVSLRLGARPMHRRGYKLDTGAGTLHPPVAAALARIADPAAHGVVLDPFCGDGTILVETVLAYPLVRAAGADIDPRRVASTRANAQRAGVAVEVARADAARASDLLAHLGAVDVVLTNPPWNLAVDAAGGLAGSLGPFWRALRAILRNDGRLCAVTDAGLGVPATLREMGYRVGLDNRVRLAGRVSDLIIAAPPGGVRPDLPRRMARWRRRAVDAGAVLAL